MTVVFHIGMGKTGTSSVQQALARNEDGLRAQGWNYLGLWPDILDSVYRGYEGLQYFLTASPAEMIGHAEEFAERLAARGEAEGTGNFILSNEMLFSAPRQFGPFLEALKDLTDLRVVIYMRDPRSWLPSAYTQWHIKHKQAPGPIQGFEHAAPDLIRRYEPIRYWSEAFPDHLTVREFSTDIDVVQDFAALCGFALEENDTRKGVREETAATVLRALYGNRFAGPTWPNDFNRAVLDLRKERVTSLEAIVQRCFDFSRTGEFAEQERETMDFIRDAVGLDLLGGEGDTTFPSPNLEAIRARVTDYLIEICFRQSAEIHALKRRLDALDGGAMTEGEGARIEQARVARAREQDQ